MRNLWVVVALVAACSKGRNTETRTGSGSAAAVGSSGSTAAAGSAAHDGSAGAGSSGPAVAVAADAGADDAGAVDAGVAAPFFPDKLGEKEGIILAEKQGGTVKGIPDGTKVEVVSVTEMMVGSPVTGEAKIKYDGKKVTLPPARVLYGGKYGSTLHYSPDRKHMVYVPIWTCNDICQTDLWLVGADGRRAHLGGGTVDYYDAWKGDTLAVSAGVMWIVSLTDYTFKKYDKYMSPSFSPDGVLFVRDEEGSAYTLIDGKAKQVWKAPKKEEGEDEDPYNVDGPPPVKWKDGKPDFSTDFLPDDAK